METLSFVLGIAFIVVIALAIVATYAFVKVIKVQKEINDPDEEDEGGDHIIDELERKMKAESNEEKKESEPQKTEPTVIPQ